MEELNTFTAPIAGQSLTNEPRSYEWERPPEMNEAGEAIDFYIERLGNQAVMDDVFTALESGFPLSILVESILGVGVMEGKHSIDVSLLAYPVLHEYIMMAARIEEVNVTEFPVSQRQSQNESDMEALKGLLVRAVDRAETPDEGTALLEDVMEQLDKRKTPDDKAAEASAISMSNKEMREQKELEQMDEMPMEEEEQPRGLMARRM